MSTEKMSPVHPGEILEEDFLKPLGISPYRLAKAINVHPRRINEIVRGERKITAETALRLAQFFNTSPEVWLNLQSHYDLEIAKDQFEEQIKQEVHPLHEQ